MPVHLLPLSRRAFLTRLGAVTTLASSLRAAGSDIDPNLIAILNDTHIGGAQPPDSAVPSNLRATIASLLRLPRRPAVVVINGDLALKDGQPKDYEHFSQLIAPLTEAGLPVHLTLGNHDDRTVLARSLKGRFPPNITTVPSKHISIVKTAQANLFLLDSLKATMVTQGLLGDAQLEWLNQALHDHADKPALIFAHHNPRLGGDSTHFPGGLEDSDALWEVLVAHPHVKAYLHGHIHHRDFYYHRGIHLLNTPATSYVANREISTTGWTLAHLHPTGGDFTTLTHDATHRWNGVTEHLCWR